MNEAIQIERVSKCFGAGHAAVQALSDLTFSVTEGEMVAIAGPSGSGKSTLLAIIGAIESVDSGRVTVAGKELSRLGERELSRYRRRHIGFVFQDFNLLTDLTARENIELPLILNRVKGPARTVRIANLVERLGLEERIQAYPSELSSGERQRVAIARAVVHRPDVLLADEPTANLDTDNATEVVSLLDDLRKEEEITMLLATHDPRVIDSAQTRRLLLCDGRLASVDR